MQMKVKGKIVVTVRDRWNLAAESSFFSWTLKRSQRPLSATKTSSFPFVSPLLLLLRLRFHRLASSWDTPETPRLKDQIFCPSLPSIFARVGFSISEYANRARRNGTEKGKRENVLWFEGRGRGLGLGVIVEEMNGMRRIYNDTIVLCDGVKPRFVGTLFSLSLSALLSICHFCPLSVRFII